MKQKPGLEANDCVIYCPCEYIVSVALAIGVSANEGASMEGKLGTLENHTNCISSSVIAVVCRHESSLGYHSSHKDKIYL